MERREGSVEAKGRNVDEAIAAGLAELGLKRDDVDIEIIARGSRGVLGLGAEDARVLLTPRPKTAPTSKPVVAEETKPAPPAKPEPKAVERKIERPVESYDELGEDEDDEVSDLAGADLNEIQKIASDALSGLLKHMSIQARVVAKTPSGHMIEGNNPPPILLDIQGDDLGVLIGRRGETLGALQYLVRLIVNRQTRRWINVVVDVEGYKERRERQLEQLAERMAERVVATQKPFVLEAMPPYERRIIHLTLRNHPAVTTHSIGEGDSRKVMIILK